MKKSARAGWHVVVQIDAAPHAAKMLTGRK